jgi:hypothetical protein
MPKAERVHSTPPQDASALPIHESPLSPHQLIDEDTGEVNVTVLKRLARREAMATYGAITPRSLRSALREYAGIIPQMQTAWRQRHGLPVEYVMVTPYGRVRDGLRHSAF